MKPRRIPAGTSIALIASIAGCYSYVPAEVGSIPPRSDVRAHVTSGQAALLDPLVVHDGRIIEGELLENGAAGLLLLVPVAGEARGMRAETLHQRVLVTSADIVQLDLRQLDRTRTGLLIAGGAALVGGILIHQLTGDQGGDTSSPVPTPPENRVPIGIRIAY